MNNNKKIDIGLTLDDVLAAKLETMQIAAGMISERLALEADPRARHVYEERLKLVREGIRIHAECMNDPYCTA